LGFERKGKKLIDPFKGGEKLKEKKCKNPFDKSKMSKQ